MLMLGLAGTGYINEVHTRTAKNIHGVSVNAVYSRDKKKAESFAEKFGIQNSFDNYEAMLNSSIDAVIIGLPTPLHKEYSIKAFEKSKHVLCEKPIALSVEDANEMKNYAQKCGVIFMVAHVLRFWHEYIAAKKLIGSGSIGKIRKMYTYRFSALPEWSSGNWLLDTKQSGGVPVDLQIHDIDFILWVLGEPKSLKAAGNTNNNNLIINSSSVFQYADATAVTEAGYLLPKDLRFEMGFKIITESAIVEYYNLREPTLTIMKNGRPPESIYLDQANAYSEQLSYFKDCVINNFNPERIKTSDAIEDLSLSLQIKSLIEASNKI